MLPWQLLVPVECSTHWFAPVDLGSYCFDQNLSSVTLNWPVTHHLCGKLNCSSQVVEKPATLKLNKNNYLTTTPKPQNPILLQSCYNMLLFLIFNFNWLSISLKSYYTHFIIILAALSFSCFAIIFRIDMSI